MSSNKRLDRLREKLCEDSLDAILVSSSENRRYLSGFTGSAGFLLISQEEALLATDFRYLEQAARQSPEFQIKPIRGKFDWFPDLTYGMEAKRVGFDSAHMTVDVLSAFNSSLDKDNRSFKSVLVPTKGFVDGLRVIKDGAELNSLAKAVEIADQALDQIKTVIEPGVAEKEIAWGLEKSMRDLGAESVAFDIIVGAGPNGALPHHRADDTMIKRGDAVVIDMGATYQGYRSDLTRTISVGEPDETFRRVYDIVLRAQLEAEEKIEVGMTGAEADAIARDIITEAGYGDNFGHSLGHGVGLAVHEEPGLSPNSLNTLENGMVFTVEPGIYLSGWGGIRIEDVVVMERGRVKVLTKSCKRQCS